MKPKLNIIRRALTSALLSVSSLFVLPVFAEHFTEGKQVPPTTGKLKPGDFVWAKSPHAERGWSKPYDIQGGPENQSTVLP
jgi:hypothetical protein